MMRRRHELDPVSLTFGAVFAGLGLLFLFGQADQALRLRWVWPLLLLALGLGILLDVLGLGILLDDGPSHRRSGLDRNTDPDTDPALEPGADLEPYGTVPDRGPYPADPDRDRTG